MALGLSLGCVGCFGRSHHQGNLLGGTDSVDEKVKRAAAIATAERLARLKAELRKHFPDLAQTDLEGMRLTWQATTFHSFTGRPDRTEVYVIVTLTGSQEFANRVLAEACSLLAPEVNPADASAS